MIWHQMCVCAEVYYATSDHFYSVDYSPIDPIFDHHGYVVKTVVYKAINVSYSYRIFPIVIFIHPSEWGRADERRKRRRMSGREGERGKDGETEWKREWERETETRKISHSLLHTKIDIWKLWIFQLWKWADIWWECAEFCEYFVRCAIVNHMHIHSMNMSNASK